MVGGALLAVRPALFEVLAVAAVTAEGRVEVERADFRPRVNVVVQLDRAMIAPAIRAALTDRLEAAHVKVGGAPLYPHRARILT